MQHHRFGCNRWCYCDHNSKLLQYVKNITTNKCCVANILNFVAVGWCYCNHFEILLQYLGNNAMISLSCNRLDCRCNSKVLLPLLTKWLRLLLTIAINIICCYTVLFGCRRLVYIATKKIKRLRLLDHIAINIIHWYYIRFGCRRLVYIATHTIMVAISFQILP